MEGIKLHLGCGEIKMDGYVNIDVYAGCNPDLVIDLNKAKLPFKDNSVSYIYSYHMFEHLDPMRFMHILNELYRVSKPGCIWEIHVPYYNSSTLSNLNHHIDFGFHSFTFIRPHHPRNYFSNVKGELVYVKHSCSSVGKLMPKWLSKRLSFFIGHLVVALEYRIKIIK